MPSPGREDIWIKHFNRVERKSPRAFGGGYDVGSGSQENGARSRNGKADAAGELAELAGLSSDRSSDTVERILKVAREHLGMDVAFVSEFTGGEQVYRRIEGDAESFGLCEGEGIALEGTYCWRLVGGTLSNVIRDARNDERVKGLDVTRDADIGSYVAVPLQYSDGRLYGTLCCVSHVADPSLRGRDAEFMKVLARLMIEQLEREELESKTWRLRVQATGAGALLAALEARDGYTGEHSAAVVELSVAVARRLELPEEEIADVEQAALLHDIGKMGVPDAILNKAGPLDDREWAMMREHPVIGERIVSSVEGLAHLASIVRAEHERWNGKGYPDGLSGEEIPLASRIVFTCDAFHAMISDRPYRKALGVRTAIAELKRNCGTQFCPGTVEALLDAIHEWRLTEKEEKASQAHP